MNANDELRKVPIDEIFIHSIGRFGDSDCGIVEGVDYSIPADWDESGTQACNALTRPAT